MSRNARPKRPIPPFLRRRFAWFLALLFTLSIAGPVAQWLVRGRLGTWAHILAAALPGVGCALLAVQFGFAKVREYKRAVKAEGRVCFDCGYALDGLPDAGQCPECGKAYALDDLKRRWRISEQAV